MATDSPTASKTKPGYQGMNIAPKLQGALKQMHHADSNSSQCTQLVANTFIWKEATHIALIFNEFRFNDRRVVSFYKLSAGKK